MNTSLLEKSLAAVVKESSSYNTFWFASKVQRINLTVCVWNAFLDFISSASHLACVLLKARESTVSNLVEFGHWTRSVSITFE